MSRQLVVNTQVDRSYPRSTKWQPSPETSAAITEEDDVPLATKHQHRTSTVYEQDEDEEEEEDEEDEDEEDDLDEDDDSTFTSSPSIPDENINFDLVYALHTFVATVEGQASVVKGDALTLLDDSNSYWWLVSVLKTSEVGYIPAENIETPFERLARLNKHRNAELTSDDQAQHYIENATTATAPRKKASHGKRVTVNKGLSIQVQIILTGDDEDQEVGEAYEEYEEEMATDDEEDEEEFQEEQIDNEDEKSNTVRDQDNSSSNSSNRGAEHLQEETTSVHLPKVNLADKAPVSQQQQQRNATSPILLPPSSAADDDKKNALWRLFSRNKKDNTRTSTEDTDSGSISSMASSVMSEDKGKPRETNGSNASNLTVLRVFAGNINVGAMYHSLLVDENTSAEQLLVQAMGRFHIAQIEDKTAGRHSRTITPTGVSGVEYYLTVKAMNGDEITLAPQDKPLTIFQSLNDHLTTPMPSLTHVKQFSQQLSKTDISKAGALKARQRHKARLGEDSAIRFYLHKRIRRVNERAGLVYIKISLETSDVADNQKSSANQRSSGFSTRTLRRKKAPPVDTPNASIQKLIAVSANICIAELLDTALEKFHIAPSENDHYRLSVVPANRKTEKLLGGNMKLVEILHDDTPGAQADGDKLFILRKVGGSRPSSRESPRSYSSKVAPERMHGRTIARKEVNLRNLTPGHPAAIAVPIVDSKIEAALNRLDRALTSLKREKQQTGGQSNMVPAMAVARNSDQGVDVVMHRGILCSKPLSRNQVQYSLLAIVDGKRQLVTQKVLQSNAIPSVSRGTVSEADMVTVVEYGTSFLEAQEKKNGRKATGINGAPALLLSSDILDSSGEQTSSLDDLDKEFQRIIAAHAF